MWNTTTGEAPFYDTIAFLDDSANVVLGETSGSVHVVSLGEHKTIRSIPTSLTRIKSMAVSLDGQRIAICSDVGALVVHDLNDGQQVHAWPAGDWRIRDVCFGASHRYLFAVHDLPAEHSLGEGPPGPIVVLDVQTGRAMGWLKGHKGKVNNIQRSADGLQLITSSDDGTARMWRADLQPGDAVVVEGCGPVAQAVYSPNGKQVLVTAAAPKRREDWKGFALICDAASGRRQTVLTDQRYAPGDPLVQHGIRGVFHACFSPDGTRVLTISDDCHVAQVDPQFSGAELFAKPESAWPIAARLPYTPVRVWDAHTGRELFALQGLVMQVVWAGYNQDGSKIITLCMRRTQQTLLQKQSDSVKVISTGGGIEQDTTLAQLHVWDGRTGKLLVDFRDRDNPTSDLSGSDRRPLAISPDGNWLALTQWNGLIDLATNERYSLPGIWSSSTPLFSAD
ncbi:MAG: hypothetical protein KDA60_22810, partial [Planctomycetales bacterium]|nr:hypothetical protein [Planctomycetales bacterium]